MTALPGGMARLSCVLTSFREIALLQSWMTAVALFPFKRAEEM